MLKKKIKVLIVDDSALVREILEKGLSSDPEIEVVGKAANVYAARDKIVFKRPDVLTLDIEMPGMDGLEFLKRLMPQYPLPVVMVSAMSSPGAKVTLDALEYGAVDFVLKPSVKVGVQLTEMFKELIEKVKAASTVDVSQWKNNRKHIKQQTGPVSKVLEGSTDKVIAIGASTGGTTVITSLVKEFPADMPGTVIVQHMPPVFTQRFAENLNSVSKLEVKEAATGDRIVKGRVLIAPGGKHMKVVRSGGIYLVRCVEGEKVNGHCPSVDLLFDSVATHAGSNAVGVILTGMGADGARGILAMRKAGAKNYGQDEASSVVFGMAREAYNCGGVERLVPLDNLAATIINAVNSIKDNK